MKAAIHLLSFIFLFSNLSPAGASENWQEVTGEHFIVYFMQDESFAKDVSYKAETYYKNIASELGYPRYADFWLWEKRVKIYIYPDHDSYLKATGQPEWSRGLADYTNKRIISYAWSEEFVDSLLPHEIAHLIFRDFVGIKGEIPLWLDEGVAQWAEETKRKEFKQMTRELLMKDALLSLDDMMKIDVRTMVSKGKVYIRPTRTRSGDEGVLLISGDSLVSTYYLQAASLVGFLIEKHASDNFAEFCRQLRDGRNLEEALRKAYSTHVNDLSELEKKWRDYLEEE